MGDWGLGIAQSPIPNPQSPIRIYFNKYFLTNFYLLINTTY